MAKMVVACPSCGKRLETGQENAGRFGQCPFCQNVFELVRSEPSPAARAAASDGPAGWLGGTAPEYREPGALVGTLGLLVFLLLIALTSRMPWVRRGGAAVTFAELQQERILLVSLVCSAFVAISLVGRRSLVASVVVGGAWAMLSAALTGGLLHALGRVARRSPGFARSFRARPGLYLAVIASMLALSAAVYVFISCRNRSEAFWQWPLVLGATQLLALGLGIFLIAHHLVPGVEETVPTSVRRRPRPGATAPSPGEPGPAGAEGVGPTGAEPGPPDAAAQPVSQPPSP